jgi:hypothetical protein
MARDSSVRGLPLVYHPFSPPSSRSLEKSETLPCGSGMYISSLSSPFPQNRFFPSTTTMMQASQVCCPVPRALGPHSLLLNIEFPRTTSPEPPRSPPPLKHEGSPYARSALPAVPEDHPTATLRIQRVLSFALKPKISFDLSHHPSTITTLPGHRQISLFALSELATTPPLPSMTIVSPDLPWSITVVPPSPHKANQFVTVSDVLVALHRTLGLAVTITELRNLPSADAVSRVIAAYERRVKEIADNKSREAMRRKGVKRVDFLMEHRRFLGLSRMGRDPDVFALNVF